MKAIPAALVVLRGTTGYCPAYDLMEKNEIKRQNINIRHSLIVKKPIHEVYSFWRKLENLPLFMTHLESVNVDGSISTWKAKIFGGIGFISWKAVIVNEIEDEVIGWSSLDESLIDNAGKIEFIKDNEFSTQINVVISYRAPLGIAGEKISRLFTPAFENVIRADIDNFKDFMEAGFTEKHPTDFRNQLI